MLNMATIQGRLTKDIDFKQTNNGTKVAQFCVAVQRNFKDKNGNYEADFIDCNAFDKIADFISKYFHKGDMIIVTGELQAHMYEDKNGAKHKVTHVVVGKAMFDGSPKRGGNSNNSNAGNREEPNELNEEPDNLNDDSLDTPFA